NSADNQWIQQADLWRKNVAQLLVREKQTELAAAATVPATSATVPAASAASTSPAPGNALDPVVGQWWLENRTLVILGADHTITGGRHGTWVCTNSTEGRRAYQLHFPPPKNWTDYLTLSEHGRSLTGHT